MDVLPPTSPRTSSDSTSTCDARCGSSRCRREDDSPGRLVVETDRGVWRRGTSSTRRAPGRVRSGRTTPGQKRFRGRQLHVADYVSADEFAGKRVVIVGAGISAVQLLDEISHVADTFWVTRREPEWSDEAFDIPARVAAIAGVEDRVRRGLPPGSVISVTGMHWTPWARAAQERGVLVRHPMFAVDRGGRRAHAGRHVRRGGRHPVGDRVPSGDRPSGAPAPAHTGGRHPRGEAGAPSTSRDCSSSGTGRRSPPSARTAPVARRCVRSSRTGSPSQPETASSALGRRTGVLAAVGSASWNLLPQGCGA